MNILSVLTEIMSEAFEKSGYSASFGGVTVSNRPDLCHYQCNGALPAAKTHKKNPMTIAGEVADILRAGANTVFASVETAPPGFINLRLSGAYLAELAQAMADDGRLLLPLMESKNLVIDFGGPNVAKPLHVGHLRSAIIGDSLCRMARFLGHNVTGDIHLGDWGLQMGLVIASLEEKGLTDFTAADLNEIYPASSKRAKTDPAFANHAAERTAALQNGEPAAHTLWQKIREVSVADLKNSYQTLGVHFDCWYGESDADPYVSRVMDILRESGILRESDGALVVDVALPEDKEPMPPMLVQKSNGADIYGTTDLGTLLQRKEDFCPDEVWYVVDNRQAFHFKQVFRCAKVSGILDGGGKETVCLHIPFGTMNGKDGKAYKTREGGVMRLSDLIDTVIGGARTKVDDSGVAMTEEERAEAARMLGMAALRVGDMVNHRTKDYIFDMERFLASEGKTGPYLQYSVVRIRSVLAKAAAQGIAGGKILPPESDAERDLLLAFPLVSDALLRAFADKAPSTVCDVLFDIAARFNRFYFEHKILQHPDEARRASWIALLGLTGRLLTVLLDILGVEVPKHM